MRALLLLASVLFPPSPALAEPYCSIPGAGKFPLSSALIRRIDRCANAQKMEVHAHRGAGNKPENTMAAFREAIRQGADTIELDLQITKDRQIVITHDVDLRANQCLHPDGKRQDPKVKAYLKDLTLAEVKRFDCGSLAQPGATPVPGERIPTLGEALALLKDNPGLRFNIEIKYPDPKFFPPLEEYIDEIIGAIEASGASPSRFFVQSFQHKALAILKKKRPHWEISPLIGGGPEDKERLKKVPYELDAKLVTPHFQAVDPETLAQLHRDGIKVVTWTANSREQMLSLIDLGVDGLITDRADLFFEIKKELCGQ